jgi:gliding motility-associated-like protein
MKTNFIKTLLLTLAMVFNVSIVFSQVDGTNFDFNAYIPGNYAGWRAYQSQNNSSGSTMSLSPWVGFTDPATCFWQGDRCFVINSNPNETDTRVSSGTNILKKIPTGYSRSTQINCAQNNRNANMLTYDLNVTPQNCLLTFNFAMVLESPGHGGYQDPFFKIDVIKLNDNTEAEEGLVQTCATFEVKGNSSTPPTGWFTYSGGIWQPWRQISMNLTNNINEKVRIKVLLASCAWSGHYAYGYFVGRVGPSVLTVNACGSGDTAALITAPSGFYNYEWYANPDNLSESELAPLATGTPIYSSEATATLPANNSFVISNLIHQQNLHGNYFVKVTSPSSSSTVPGCVAYMKAQVQVIKPVVEFTFNTDCQLTAEFSNGTTFPIDDLEAIKEYHWDFGDGTSAVYSSDDTSTNGNINPTHVYSSAGTYTVSLTASYNGCENSISYEVEIPETPSFSLTDTMICIGTNINIPIENPAMTENVTYTWTNPNEPNTFEGIMYNATFNQRTEIIVEAVAPSCIYTDTIIVDVQEFPEITLIGDTMLCLGEQSNITAMDETGNTQEMQWSFTDPGNPPQFNPNQPTTTEPILIFTPTQNTTVYLIAKTSQGCMASKSINISITDPKVVANKYKVCPGDPVVLTGMDAVDYSWSADPADPTLPTDIRSDQPVTAHPEETTIYTMKGYGASGCFAVRTIRVQVVPFPEAEISYSPAYVDVDNPVLSLRDVSQWGTSSSWTISDGTTSDARSFSHRFNDVSGDNVQIYLTTFNEVGCSDTTSVIVPIELFSVWLPSAFSPDGDGANDRFFFRSTNRLEDVKFEVYNRWGERVFLFEDDYLDCSKEDSQDLENKSGWNGQKNGVNVPIGTYVWRLSYKRLGNKRVYDRSGTINLIR